MTAELEEPKPKVPKKKADSADSGADSSDDDEIVKDLEEKKEENKNESRWTKLKSSLREWGEMSSCHGIPHMAQASTIISAAIWCIILAFCAVGFVYLFSDTLRQYLRFDKIVRLNLGLESANFPSITFCNINPYKMSKIKDVPELNALLTVYESSSKE